LASISTVTPGHFVLSKCDLMWKLLETTGWFLSYCSTNRLQALKIRTVNC